MKKLILSALLVLFLGFTQAQDVNQIKELLNRQKQAWNRGNLVEFMQGYWKSDSLLFVGQNGPNYGWQQTLDNYRKNFPDSDMGQLSFDIMEVKLIDRRNAFVLGGWSLKRKDDEPKGYFTLLVKKIKGKWFIVSDHSS